MHAASARRLFTVFASAASVLVATTGVVALGQQPAPTAPTTPKVPQPKTPKKPTTTTPATTPTSPAAPAAKPLGGPREEPKVGPYLKQVQPQDLTLNIRLVVNSDAPTQKVTYRDPFSGNTAEMPAVTPFTFQTLSVVWPLLPPTASSERDTLDVKGQLKLNDVLASDAATILKGYPGGVTLARWDAGTKAQDTSCRQVELKLEIPMHCYRTVFDEKTASAVGWPSGPWPADVRSMQAPQLYIESGVDAEGHVRAYDDAKVKEALEAWYAEAKITKPQDLKPVALAKLLTSKVWGLVQVSGDGLSFKRTGELSGIVAQPPSMTLEQGRGSEQDAALLLAALMRKAGLPARFMMGWDVGSGNDKFLSKSSKENKLKSWVEFCLYDETANTINWIPVDVVLLRRGSAKPQAMNREWRYFGTHDQLDTVAPIAMHLHPPTDVVSYGWPAFWGWFVTPATPKAAEQAVAFTATPTAKRAGDRSKPKDDKESRPATKKGY